MADVLAPSALAMKSEGWQRAGWCRPTIFWTALLCGILAGQPAFAKRPARSDPRAGAAAPRTPVRVEPTATAPGSGATVAPAAAPTAREPATAPSPTAPSAGAQPSASSGSAVVSRTPPSGSDPAAPSSSPVVSRTPPSQLAVSPAPTEALGPAPAPAAGPENAVPGSTVARSESVASVAPVTAAEKRAAKLARQATLEDHPNQRFRVGERRLREAIRICMQSGCAPAFRAQLHRDLGVVYIEGMKKVEDGKDEFTAALTAEPKLVLAAPMTGVESERAFDEVRSDLGLLPTAAESSPLRAPPEPAPRPFEEPSTADRDAEDQIWNLFSFGIQQDFIYHSKTPNACNAGSRYTCFDSNQDHMDFTADPRFQAGNTIEQSGFRIASLRLLAGYDRFLGKNVALGLRLGMSVRGKAPRIKGQSTFSYFHGEARLAVWLGSNPFGTARVRPYLFAAGGTAEMDGRIPVKVTLDGHERHFDAWKITGKGFVSAGLGLQLPFGRTHGPGVELRYVQLFPDVAPGLSLGGAYQIGF